MRRQTWSRKGVSGRAARAAVSRAAPTAPPPAETSTSPVGSVAAVRGGRRGDVAGVADQVGDLGREREGGFEWNQCRIAVDEHGVEGGADRRDDLFGAPGLFRGDEDVAHRAGDDGAWLCRARGFEERLKLEGELTAAEGIELDQDDIGRGFGEQCEERIASRGPPSVVDGSAGCVEEGGEILAGDLGRRKLGDAHAVEGHFGHGRAAQRHRHVETRLGHRRRRSTRSGGGVRRRAGAGRRRARGRSCRRAQAGC